MVEGKESPQSSQPIAVENTWWKKLLDKCEAFLQIERKRLTDDHPRLFKVRIVGLDLLRALIRGTRGLIVPVSWWCGKFLEEPLNAAVILLVLVASGAFIYGRVASWREPQKTIIISSFELPVPAPASLPITGRTAANLLKEEIDEILSKARQYAPADRFHARPVSTEQKKKQRSDSGPKDTKPKASAPSRYSQEAGQRGVFELEEGPLISSVGLEVEGISLEKILALYYAIRQDQHRIEGDVLFMVTSPAAGPNRAASFPPVEGTSCNVVVRVRMAGLGGWESKRQECDEKGLRLATEELAEEIVRGFSPNTLALYLQHTERPNEAVQILRQIVAKDPTDADSLIDLGDALLRDGDVHGAVAEYREALALEPERAERAHNNLGVAFFNNRQSAEAEAEYREAIYINRDYVQPHTNLGYLLRDNGNWDGAVREFRIALKLDPKDPDAHDDYGLWLDDTGRTAEAMVEFRKAIQLQPNDSDFHIDLGIRLERKRDFDGAITEYREAARLKPNDHWAHTDLGVALAENGEMTEAMTENTRALEIAEGRGEKFPEGHSNRAFTYELMGEYQDAVNERSLALQISPDSTAMRCDLASTLRVAGEYEAFRLNFTEAIRTATNSSDRALAYRQFGDGLQSEGEMGEAIANYQGAINEFRAIVASKQDIADTYLNLGYVLFEQGALDLSLDAFETANRLRENSDARIGIGIVLEEVGRRPAAILEYQRGVRLDPGNSVGLNNLALAFESEADFGQAGQQHINAWAESLLAVERRPKDADAHRWIADTLDGAGDYEQAVKEYNAALDLRSDDTDIIRTRAGTLDTRGEQDRAIDEYKRATHLRPTFGLAHRDFGATLNVYGRQDEASEEFERVLELKPNDIWALTDLGLVRDDQKRYEDAIELHRKAIAISNGFSEDSGVAPNFPEGHRNLCRALTHAGRYERAVEECETALEGIPHDAEAHLNYAEALEGKSEHCHFCLKRWIRESSKREYEAAEREAAAAVDFKPAAETYFLRGRAYFGLGNYDRAEEQLATALRWKAIYPKAHYYLGSALCRSGAPIGDATREFGLAHDEDNYLPLMDCVPE